jgi:hypothetical protein
MSRCSVRVVSLWLKMLILLNHLFVLCNVIIIKDPTTAERHVDVKDSVVKSCGSHIYMSLLIHSCVHYYAFQMHLKYMYTKKLKTLIIVLNFCVYYFNFKVTVVWFSPLFCFSLFIIETTCVMCIKLIFVSMQRSKCIKYTINNLSFVSKYKCWLQRYIWGDNRAKLGGDLAIQNILDSHV